jgi:tRNA (guanine37-N1)-methyltransferase
MRISIVTLFPELFEPFVRTSFVGRAIEGGQLILDLEALRGHGIGIHRSVDDTPYGGGCGMVLRVDCLMRAVEAVEQRTGRSHRALLTPQGVPFTQRQAVRLASLDHLLLLCGRYEGFDERVRGFVDEELSLGDFVMTGGEVAAMAIVEACVRLLPGVLGNAESLREESFSSEEGWLEYPQYTRPVEFRGASVPDVLRSGDHRRIAEWRRTQAEARTSERRPDLAPRSKRPE